jgi:uncharacterized glyoxalase superfamily protein PhnB
MVGVELDMVVKDSLKALEEYEIIFEIERVEVTDFPQGQNEVIFSLYNVHFHLLDENPEFHLNAPTPEDPKTSWVNVTVPDIKKTYQQALNAGCAEVQPVTEIPEMGISNAIFMDSFGYVWMLHEVHREVSKEERMKIMEDMMKKK